MTTNIKIPQHVIKKLQLGVEITHDVLQSINDTGYCDIIKISPFDIILDISPTSNYTFARLVKCKVKWNEYIIEMSVNLMEYKSGDDFLNYKFTSPECIREGSLYPSSIIEISLNVTEIESSKKVIDAIINKLNVSN